MNWSQYSCHLLQSKMTALCQLLTVSFLLCVPPCVLFLTEKSSPVWARPGRWWECYHRVRSWQQKVLYVECNINPLCHHQSSVSPSILCVTVNLLCHHQSSVSQSILCVTINPLCLNLLCHHQSSVSQSIFCVTINPLCHSQSSVSPSILCVTVNPLCHRQSSVSLLILCVIINLLCHHQSLCHCVSVCAVPTQSQLDCCPRRCTECRHRGECCQSWQTAAVPAGRYVRYVHCIICTYVRAYKHTVCKYNIYIYIYVCVCNTLYTVCIYIYWMMTSYIKGTGSPVSHIRVPFIN